MGPRRSNTAKLAFKAVSTRISRYPVAAARIGIIGLTGVLTCLTWAHWGSVQIDCGRELYVPVEILRGRLLYRDLWYPLGPLAPYLAAVLLKLFGLQFDVLYALGLLLAITSALALFELGILLEEARVGLAAAAIFLLQGFSPSIFNYVFPYAYAADLGMTLTLLCAVFALRSFVGRRKTLLVAGFAASLAMLSKQEFGAACYLFLASIIVAETLIEGSAKPITRGAWQLLPGIVLFILIYGWFFIKLTPAFMLFENWTEFPGSYASKIYGAQWHARNGLRFVPREWLLLIVNAAGALFVWSQIARLRMRIGPGAFAIATAFVAFAVAAARYFGVFTTAIEVILIALIFPIGMYFVGLGVLADALRRTYQGLADRRFIAIMALSILALILAVRVLANVMPFGYSVFYNPPLLFIFVLTLARCAEYTAHALTVEQKRVVIGSVLAAEVLLFAFIMMPGNGGRTARFNTDWGAIYLTPPDAEDSRQILEFILQQKHLGQEVLLLPEAPMFYALAGTEAPTRWYTLLPGVLSPEAERKYIVEVQMHAPRYIILTARCTKEYAAPYFGIDYNRQIFQWIERNYRVVKEVGDFRRDGTISMAALIYERKASL